ncbi:MAG: sigma-70 family RNA polymerase sigma factor [Planctomycetota bacterium]
MAGPDPTSARTDPLVERAIGGDHAALDELLRTYAPAVCQTLSIAQRWNREFDRDDIVQITSIEAILRVGSLRTASLDGFRSWLARVAENNIRDAIRRLENGRHAGAERRITNTAEGGTARTLLLQLAADDPSVNSVVGANDDVARLRAAIDRLPDSYRAVVQALDLEERSVAEVAEDLGRSKGAVHMLHARAHDRLRELLVRTG